MKKLTAIILLLGIVLSLGACGEKTEAEPPKEVITVDYPLDKYDLEAYTRPYWAGEIVYQESVLPVENRNGSIDDLSLLYPAEQIISVRSSDLLTEYQEGLDYELADGKLRILPGSAIPTVAYDVYYPEWENEKSVAMNVNYGSGYIFYSEGSVMHSMQIAVTYAHKGTFPGAAPACKKDQLPKTIAKLENGEELQICVYGDSISTGLNSSGKVGAAPNAAPWFQMFEDKLKTAYPNANIVMNNPSISGKKSNWGATEANIHVGYGPDLCIIGFGMNDGTKLHAQEYFRQNIQTIIDTARKANSDCEFVLISTMLANPEAGDFAGCQKDYLPVLQAMETEGIVVMDMTTFHESLLTQKRYCDMSGNNVNHPNDFLTRGYAQVLWQTVIGY